MARDQPCTAFSVCCFGLLSLPSKAEPSFAAWRIEKWHRIYRTPSLPPPSLFRKRCFNFISGTEQRKKSDSQESKNLFPYFVSCKQCPVSWRKGADVEVRWSHASPEWELKYDIIKISFPLIICNPTEDTIPIFSGAFLRHAVRKRVDELRGRRFHRPFWG